MMRDGTGSRKNLISTAAPVAIALLLLPLILIWDIRSDVLQYVVLMLSGILLLYGLWTYCRRQQIGISRRQILFFALLLRAILFPLQPSLSDDAWRYLWDGRLLLNGINPYHHVPADSTLAAFHDRLFEIQGYPETNTIYPPLAQVTFAASVGLAFEAAPNIGGLPFRSYYVWKILLIVAELTGLLFLLRFLERQGRSLLPAILYAWHPLVITELAGQGHTDGLWILAMGWGLYRWNVGAKDGGMTGLAFGTASRLFPVLSIPLWWRYLTPAQRKAGLLLSIPFALSLVMLFEPEAFRRFSEVAGRFTNYYEFNGGLYYGIKHLLDLAHVDPSNRIAGGITSGLFLLSLGLITFWPIRHRTFNSLLARLLGIVSLQIALTAKVHVWYFIVPLFLTLFESEPGPESPQIKPQEQPDVTASNRSNIFTYRPLWLWLTLIAPTTYLYYAVTPNREERWVLWIEWGVAGAIAAWSLVQWRRGEMRGDDGRTTVGQMRG